MGACYMLCAIKLVFWGVAVEERSISGVDKAAAGGAYESWGRSRRWL